MTVKDLETLFEYGYRANRKLLEAQSPLTAEQFTQRVAGSCGSIRNTMVHMLSAEWGWLDRCGGTSRGPALEASDYPTVASVFDRWDRVEGYVREFLSTLRDEDLTIRRQLIGTSRRGEARARPDAGRPRRPESY